MAPDQGSAFDHPSWEHFDGEDQVRAATQARLDQQEQTRLLLVQARRQVRASKLWMVVSISWCITGVVLSMIGVFGDPIYSFLGFACILASLLISLVAMIKLWRGERTEKAQYREKLTALIELRAAEERVKDETDGER